MSWIIGAILFDIILILLCCEIMFIQLRLEQLSQK